MWGVYLMKHGRSSKRHGRLAAGIPYVVPLRVVAAPNSRPIVPADDPVSILSPNSTRACTHRYNTNIGVDLTATM